MHNYKKNPYAVDSVSSRAFPPASLLIELMFVESVKEDLATFYTSQYASIFLSKTVSRNTIFSIGDSLQFQE